MKVDIVKGNRTLLSSALYQSYLIIQVRLGL